MLRRCERRRGDANGAGPTPAFLLARSHLRLGRRLRTAKNISRGRKESEPHFSPSSPSFSLSDAAFSSSSCFFTASSFGLIGGPVLFFLGFFPIPICVAGTAVRSVVRRGGRKDFMCEAGGGNHRT